MEKGGVGRVAWGKAIFNCVVKGKGKVEERSLGSGREGGRKKKGNGRRTENVGAQGEVEGSMM